MGLFMIVNRWHRIVKNERYENDIISIWYTAGSHQDGSVSEEIAEFLANV